MSQAANDPGSGRLEFGEADLAAYAEGRLSPARRRAIEGYLACNPDLAAGLMTRMHMAGGRRGSRGKRRLAAAAFGFAMLACTGSALAGWTVAERRDLDGWREVDGGDPPDYVEDAADSRQAARVRGEMASQIEIPRLDASEIRKTMRLPIPKLPASWRIRDAQVFPSDEGPSVNLLIDAADGRRLELFAVRTNSWGNDRPEIARRGREAVAFWERGEAAYVLSGPQSPTELLRDASVLSRSANL